MCHVSFEEVRHTIDHTQKPFEVLGISQDEVVLYCHPFPHTTRSHRPIFLKNFLILLLTSSIQCPIEFSVWIVLDEAFLQYNLLHFTYNFVLDTTFLRFNYMQKGQANMKTPSSFSNISQIQTLFWCTLQAMIRLARLFRLGERIDTILTGLQNSFSSY